MLWHRGGTLAPPLDQPTYSLRTSQGGFRKLHVPTQAHHDAFLHTTALMSGPLLQMKNICLLGLPCACGILQDCKNICPMMIIILFCAVLCWFGAGGPYMIILHDIETIPLEPRQVFCHQGITLKHLVGRSVPHV